jgi:predicted extracellular nuclease
MISMQSVSRRLWAVLISVAVAVALFLVPVGAGATGHLTPIYDIQGAGHLSPYADGDPVTTQGVVTARAFRGLYVQDPSGDGNEATSDGIVLFNFSLPGSWEVGDCVELEGEVEERIAGGAVTGNLSTTQMAFPAITEIDCEEAFGPGYEFPAPVVIGTSGRIPPNVLVISPSDEPVNLQLTEPASFDVETDGIDFYESLEGMLVTVEDPVAVSATRTFNAFSSELFTLPNNGAHIAPPSARNARGGIDLQPSPTNTGDQNPERVQIQFDPDISGGASVPAITVGDQLTSVTGVVGYSFGNFEVNATHEVTFADGGLGEQTTSLTGTGKTVTVASYNVLNLDATSADDNQRATLASQITNNLGGPDVIAVQEIQDNNGTIDDGNTDATQTLQMLVDAIAAAGGPTYSFFDVAPANNTSGGVPGGNIRNAFLYNADRVKLVDFVSLTPDVLTDMGVSDPNAFFGTRNPLVGTFKFSGKEFTVVNNHLTSRFGSTPVFGGPQPFVQAGEIERAAQTGALNEVTDALLARGRGNAIHASKSGRVMVVGDLNTMQWTDDLTVILPGTGADKVLTNLINGLTDDEVYTFNFEGNSQVLDSFFVTDNLLGSAEFDIVHVNVDFPRVSNSVGSDHEPLLASFKLK